MTGSSLKRNGAGDALQRDGLPPSAIRLSALLVFVLTVLAFAPSLRNELVNWDDRQNLVQNQAYQGLTLDHLDWMFGTSFGGHYQPLTWLSFALDHHWWGVNAAGFHLTNLLLHAAMAAGVFFLALRLLRGGPDHSIDHAILLGAIAATLLFAVHPLRVESVAWATERRDVLSGMWLVLTVICYVRAADSKRPGSYGGWLALSLLFYALSLLSKAAGLTLPFVLLLLDVFPLRRRRWRRVLTEKGLFLAPAVVFGLLALWAQGESGAMRSLAEHPVSLRIGQAFYGLVFYPVKTLWPTGLAPLYEQRPDATALDAANLASACVVVVLTLMLWRLRRRRPALLTAWAAYILLLSPVLGLAQSGPQVVADRYSYLSCIPWTLVLGAGVVSWWRHGTRRRRTMIAVTGMALVVLLAFLTRSQIRIWHNSRTLWTATIQRGASDGIARANLAVVLNEAGEFEAACQEAGRALETLPGNRSAHRALGRCSLELNELAEAEEHYAVALEIAAHVGKTDTATLASLAVVKTRLGKHAQAERLYRECVAVEPDIPEWHFNIAGFLASRGRSAEAMASFAEGLRLDPTRSEPRFRLAVLQLASGSPVAAKATLETGLVFTPQDARLGAKLAWILATCRDDGLRDGTRALDLARTAIEETATPDAAAFEALAAALAENGDFTGAVKTLESLLAERSPELPVSMKVRLEEQVERYRQGQPTRE
jgi:tetratricopeptide (TPR) repeat protein